MVTQKEIDNEMLENLLLDYQKELFDSNLTKAKNIFQRINKIITEVTTLGVTEKLYCKIFLLQVTPAGMLEIIEPALLKFNEKSENLFQKVSDKYDQYNRRYWLKIDKNTLTELDEKHLNDMVNVADETIELFERVFNYYFKPTGLPFNSPDNPLEDIFNITLEKLPSIIYEALEIIERGEQKLNPIMPMLLVLAKGKIFDKKIQDVIDIADKLNKINVAAIIDKESKNFRYTARLHWAKGAVSIFICFLLGILTIIWALGMLGISQNMECSNYIPANSYLCQLATLSKQFLVGAVLLTGIYASLRSYFANANSGAINSHRFNALQAFKHLYKDTEGDDKSLVLQKATEAIFEHLPTGFTKYHKEESKSSDNSAQLTPLIAASLAATTKAITKDSGS